MTATCCCKCKHLDVLTKKCLRSDPDNGPCTQLSRRCSKKTDEECGPCDTFEKKGRK